MTEADRDPKLAQRYRELGAEEPPRALDEAILAAARRQARPWTRRWAVPLSLAAVVVLSVTVTLRMQHEQPGIEAPTVAKEAAPAAALPAKPAAPEPEAAEVRKAAPSAKVPARARSGQPAARDEPRPFARAVPEREERAADAARADMAGSGESRASGAMAPEAAPAPAPPKALARSKQSELGVLAKPAQESPEQELERIAALRRDGKHDEADKALAEFRKRLPDYRIPPAMLERVERR